MKQDSKIVRSATFLFLSLALMLAIGVGTVAQEVETEDGMVVTPDGIRAPGIEITPEGVRVGNIKVKNDGEISTDDESTVEGEVYKGGDFSGVDLSGKSFRGATFQGTDFRNANLSNVDFTGAKFHGSDFYSVNLEGACFINAKLHAVEFYASNLNGTIFTGSARYSTKFNDTDTSGVIWSGSTECPSSAQQETTEVSSRPEVIKAESIKEALITGPDSKIDLTVNFETGSDEIKSQAHVQVYEIATALKSPELSNKRILIEGHTDNVGEDDYNVDLSYRRAVRVMRVLSEEYGIDTTRLQVKGYGEGSPVASNNSDQGRALNRRVTLVNIGSM